MSFKDNYQLFAIHGVHYPAPRAQEARRGLMLEEQRADLESLFTNQAPTGAGMHPATSPGTLTDATRDLDKNPASGAHSI
ncbi:hypothetical protein [Catenulispora rubra]|uniref:hypothetical protein n=1 Tax=Catenulispora rubra TaxID=280293 RepID=UPI0018920DEC|nr:hypothetical protein [Catenulispora rubra]